jgi:hypothetical protein
MEPEGLPSLQQLTMDIILNHTNPVYILTPYVSCI